MPRFRPSELASFLAEVGTGAKKSLSQNFLIDGNILKKIIAVADVQPGDLVVEIGPGPGALTESLLNTGAEVIAIEMDPIFAQHLRGEKLTVVQGDFLKWDLAHIPRKAKIVANIPYQITAPLLAKVLPETDLFESVTFMVQLEVAQRICGKENSSLSVFCALFGTPKLCFKVGRGCFTPAPKVDSAVISIKLHKPPIENVSGFLTMTRQAFQQRRKTLAASLASYGKEKVLQALESQGLNTKSRPEELSLEAFLALFAHLT